MIVSQILAMRGLIPPSEIGAGEERLKELVSEKDYSEVLAESLGLEYVDLENTVIDRDLLTTIPASFLRKHHLIPLEDLPDGLKVAMSNPSDLIALDDISSLTNGEVFPVVASHDGIQAILNNYVRSDEELVDISESMEASVEDEDTELLEVDDTDEPVVRFVNLVISQAIQDRATDIHIEPQEKDIRVRYRIDGVLHEVHFAPKSIQSGVISRLKIMSGLNITERRRPQDGRFSISQGNKSIDLRIATIPTVFGENVVMRLLDNSNTFLSAKDMEMSDYNYSIFEEAFKKPHGMILATGPTGSGKALRLDTKIPTPTGFTTMGDLKVGDVVLDSKFEKTTVIGLSEIDHNPELYKLVLSDGQEIYADAHHQWIVSTHDSRNHKSHHKYKKKLLNSKNGLLASKSLLTLSTLYTEELVTLAELYEIVCNADGPSIIPSQYSLVQHLKHMNTPMYKKSGSKTFYVEAKNALVNLAKRLEEKYSFTEKSELMVLSTKDMVEIGTKIGDRNNFSINTPKVIDFEINSSKKETKLPIDPYILGVWLGDGNSDGGRITVGKEDFEATLANVKKHWKGAVITREQENSFTLILGKRDKSLCIRGHKYVEGKDYCEEHNTCAKSKLPSENVSLGYLLAKSSLRLNKHIPIEYLCASFPDRLSLLQGLMDTDGTVIRGSSSFSVGFSDENLAYSVLSLVRSLGIKATIRSKIPKYLNNRGEYIEFKEHYTVSFSTSIPVFKLGRKLDRVKDIDSKTRDRLYIKSIEKVSENSEEYGSVRCITVDSPDSSYLCADYVVTHNSTTLYGTVNEISTPEIKVITVEDPVEYRLDGVNQISVNPKTGMTFSNTLRSMLRADPDVILVGEIRDDETAKTSIEAALTGHLVLSTLHTNDAPGAVTRLVEMGVEPFLVGSSLECVVAQRLVRRLCTNCKQEYHESPESLENLGIKVSGNPLLYKASENGCTSCSGTGYRGRVAIYEVMKVDEKIQKLVVEGVDSKAMRRAAVENGMIPLRDDGWRKVLEGVTSIEEVLRVGI